MCVCVGNASQVSDGAAAVLMGRRCTVETLGLPVLGILRAGAVVGVPPDVMGIGPAYAIPAALEKAGRWAVLLLLHVVLHHSGLFHLSGENPVRGRNLIVLKTTFSFTALF